MYTTVETGNKILDNNRVFNDETDDLIFSLALEYSEFYNGYLKKNNLIDFSDMILKSIPLILAIAL